MPRQVIKVNKATTLDGFAGFLAPSGGFIGGAGASTSHDESIDLFEEPTESSQPAGSKMTIPYFFFKDLLMKEPLSIQRKPISNDWIKAGIPKSGIPIIDFPTEDNAAKERYESVISTVRKRFAKRLKRARDARGEINCGQDLQETLFCLEGEDLLIDWDRYLKPDSQPLSQGSACSSVRLSQLSEIERIEPMPKPPTPETKELENLNPEYRRRKMADLLKTVRGKATQWNSSVKNVLCTLGGTHYYGPDRPLSTAFKNLGEGNISNGIPTTMPLAQAAYFKSNFANSQRLYKRARLFCKPYVIMPTDGEVVDYMNGLTPDMKRVNGFNGYKVSLRDAITSHLTRQPEFVLEKMVQEYEQGKKITAFVSTGLDG